MGLLRSSSVRTAMSPPHPSYSDYQRHMYKLEKLDNFRFLYTLLAFKSSRPLQIEDVVSQEIHRDIQLVGEFADISYSPVALERVFQRLQLLSQKPFPLEGYEAVPSSKLILPFEGEVANVKGLVAYRPTTKQLVVGICGTQTLMQALYGINCIFQRRTKGEQSYRVHGGFLSMYTGLEALAFKGIRKGLEEEDVKEVVVSFLPLQIGPSRFDRKNSSSLDIPWEPLFRITSRWSC
jgi:hypothetical protein